MNCANCFHADIAHSGRGGDSLLRRGPCCVPGCPCKAFVDSIQKIDEELA